MADTQLATQPANDGPRGIGGWLVLPTIGLVVTPLTGVIHLATYPSVFASFSLLTGAQQLFIIVEFLCNIALTIVLPIMLMVRLFNKKAGFPPLYIKWAALNFAFLLADLAVAKILFGDIFQAAGISIIDAETGKSILRAVVLVVIWIPYMLNSRRVRNTFVN